MKRFKSSLFSVLMVALMIAGMAFAATPGFRQDPGTGDILGGNGYQSDPGKIFRMVRYVPAGTYASSSTLSADSIVIWDLTSDDGITITTTSTSYDSAVAGIIVTNALTPDAAGQTAVQARGKRNWTWLQTYGLSQVNVTPNAAIATAGDALATSVVAGEAVDFLPSTTASNLNGNAGFFYDTAAAGEDDVEVFLRLD